MKVSVYIAASVDGYIARKDGDISWLHDDRYAVAGEDFGYANFMSEVDCIVMGRGTYEKILEFEDWPFAGKRVVVLSRSLRAHVQKGEAEVTSDSPVELTGRLQAEGVSKIYVDGGKTIQSFLKHGLVDEMTITRIPILLGDGLPLFGESEVFARLQHLSTRAFPNGFVQSTWSTES